MLLDKTGRKVEILEVTEGQWKTIVQEIPRRIIELLGFTEEFLKTDGSERICAGLYTYAIEEYGKLLLLKSCTPSSGKVQIKYKDEFTNHKAKFSTAFQNLPEECKRLYKGVFDPEIFDRKIFDTDEIAEHYARLAIFYTDFEDLSGRIKPVLSVDKRLLQTAITSLKSLVLKETIP
jgi:AbiV family abortive infection protein